MARVLVIDDNDLVRDLLRTVLEGEGHDVVEAADGEQGVRTFAREAVELVICDVLMPNKDGLETVRELRNRNSKVPIITMTGGPILDETMLDHGEIDYLRMTLAFGATRAIAKPFRPAELIRVVDSCLAAMGPARS
jgi:CheY-like chemotaxis protein